MPEDWTESSNQPRALGGESVSCQGNEIDEVYPVADYSHRSIKKTTSLFEDCRRGEVSLADMKKEG